MGFLKMISVLLAVAGVGALATDRDLGRHQRALRSTESLGTEPTDSTLAGRPSFGALHGALPIFGPCHPPVVATGAWRDRNIEVAMLEQEMKCSIELIDQVDEADLAAQCAYKILKTKPQLLNHNGLTLYVEGGQGSTQLTVLDNNGEVATVTDSNGKVVKLQKFASGFPKSGTVRYDDKQKALVELMELMNEVPKGQIELVVAFGSLWYILENHGALPDEDELPQEVTTKGQDFAGPAADAPPVSTAAADASRPPPPLQRSPKWKELPVPAAAAKPDPIFSEFSEGFRLAETFLKVPMLVIRNVKVDGKIRKITWGGVRPENFIDLGTGKAALTNPTTGKQIVNENLPGMVPDVNQIEKFLDTADAAKVLALLKTMIIRLDTADAAKVLALLKTMIILPVPDVVAIAKLLDSMGPVPPKI